MIRWVCYNFVGLVSGEHLRFIQLHSGAMPEFVMVDSQNFPNVEIVGDNGVGILNECQIVFSRNHYEALRDLFLLKVKIAHLG